MVWSVVMSSWGYGMSVDIVAARHINIEAIAHMLGSEGSPRKGAK